MRVWVLLAILFAVALATDPSGAAGDVNDQIDAVFTQLMAHQFQQTPTRWLRQAHAKQHGCLQVRVLVDEGLQPPLAAGIFQPGASYPAFVRFSNGAGRGFTPPPQFANESDAAPDTRGMALKVFNVTGDFVMPSNGSQAFTMTTSPTSFLATPEIALGFFTAVQKGALSLTGFLLKHPSVAAGLASTSVYGAIDNLLTATFFTAPAQMHGDIPAKYSIRPCSSSEADIVAKGDALRPEAERLDPDFLRDNLIRDVWTDLSPSKAICMQWSVQLFESEQTTPVEDTTVKWTVPFHNLAKVFIPRQYVWDEGKLAFCRHMSFNPWLTIAEHQPVGFLQDIRRRVYTSMATQRRGLRQQTQADASYEDYVNYPSL